MRKFKTAFMLVEMLLVAAALMIIAIIMLKLYNKQPAVGLNKETKKVAAQAGVDTTNYQTTIDSVKGKLQDIQEKHFEELDKNE